MEFNVGLDTIIELNKPNPKIYYGKVLAKYDSYFIFALVIGYRKYQWECHYDYWKLIPGE